MRNMLLIFHWFNGFPFRVWPPWLPRDHSEQKRSWAGRNKTGAKRESWNGVSGSSPKSYKPAEFYPVWNEGLLNERACGRHYVDGNEWGEILEDRWRPFECCQEMDLCLGESLAGWVVLYALEVLVVDPEWGDDAGEEGKIVVFSTWSWFFKAPYWSACALWGKCLPYLTAQLALQLVWA